MSSQAVCYISVAGFLGMNSGQFGPDRLCCGDGPAHRGRVQSSPGSYPLSARSTLPVVRARNVSGCCQKPSLQRPHHPERSTLGLHRGVLVRVLLRGLGFCNVNKAKRFVLSCENVLHV